MKANAKEQIKQALSTPAKIAQGVVVVVALILLIIAVAQSGDSALVILWFTLFGAVAGAVIGFNGRVNKGNVLLAAAALALVGLLFYVAI